jgi:HD-GYP domain-containing protein (c-di-GMP phosphodiesterase class II)
VLGLAQTVEVFHRAYGEDAAYDVAERRKGRWFDPTLVHALRSIRHDRAFWSSLEEDEWAGLAAVEPPDRALVADASSLDRVALGFAKVIDAKSPYTYRHSEGVADIATGIGSVLDCSAAELRELRRAGLLHDIGKLGVSNLILDKQGPLADEEWAAMRRHTEHTKVILERVPRFRELAEVASAHHERLDGSGYHRGLEGGDLSRDARILAVADVAEALSADRPYRPALAPEQVREIMSRDVGTRLCPEAYAALETYLEAPTRVSAAFREVSARPEAPRRSPARPGAPEGAQGRLEEVGVPGVPASQ